MSSEELVTQILEKGRVVLTPGSAFGPGGEGFIRMSYAASKDNLKKGLNIIEEVVKTF